MRAQSTAPDAPKQILLVEDDDELREVLRELLEAEGYAVVTAADGAEALATLRQSVAPPDLIVLDLMMPVMDGWRFRAEQQRDAALASIPVLVLSANDSPRAQALDVTDYVAKPLDIAKLLKSVGRIMRGVEHGRVQTQRAAHAEQMASLGTLTAGVAHEINNPLAYVLANLQFISREVQALRDAEGAASGDGGGGGGAERLGAIDVALGESIEGVERIRRIVDDIRSVSAVTDARRVLVDVRRVVDAAANIAANEIRHRAVLTKDYAAEIAPVEANERRLGQVFINLLVNAAHAIPEGAARQNSIRISIQPAPPGHVAVEISDTGCGIAPEIQRRIFDPFFTTKAVGVGTGLGLSICRGIVNALGGRIEVQSEVGRGTTFRIVLPTAAMPPRASLLAGAAPPSPARRQRILVVDDEAALLRGIQRMLASEHDIATAGSGREARTLLESDDAFDVILCDLLMPEMTGMDLHAALTAERPDLARRMVFMTGCSFTERARLFVDAVENPTLAKPLDVRELRTTIARVAAAANGPAPPGG